MVDPEVPIEVNTESRGHQRKLTYRGHKVVELSMKVLEFLAIFVNGCIMSALFFLKTKVHIFLLEFRLRL